MSWVAPDACTLPTRERPLRVAEFDDLFASSLRAVERPAPTLLRLTLAATAETATRNLTDRESACCTFFTFTLTRHDHRLRLDIEVPPARAGVLDALSQRATDATGPNR